MSTGITTGTIIDDESAASTKPKAPVLLFSSTLFLSALLLFQVQLIVNKHILPWFGGSAAVWTTSMLVFQLLLVAGYVYSHLITTRVALSQQFRFHALLLSAATLLLEALSVTWPSAITPSASWKSPQSEHPLRTYV